MTPNFLFWRWLCFGLQFNVVNLIQTQRSAFKESAPFQRFGNRFNTCKTATR